MLVNVYRDLRALPEANQQFVRDQDSHFRHVVAEPFAVQPGEDRLLGALIGHAASFWIWHSLCPGEGLSDAQADEAMAALVLGATAAGAIGG